MVRLLDVNILLALTNPDHLHHQRAHAWFAAVDSWATTPITETAFIRLMLNPVVAGRIVPAAEVFTVLRQLQAWPGHTFWADDSSLATPQIDTTGLVGHRLTTDFHLVNLAAQHDGVLATLDHALIRALAAKDHKFIEMI